MYNDSISYLKLFEGLLDGDRKIINHAQVTWFACVWNIWKARNEKYIFKKVEPKILVEKVKMHALKWMKIKAKEMDHNITF